MLSIQKPILTAFLAILAGSMYFQACKSSNASKPKHSTFSYDNISVDVSTQFIEYENLRLYPCLLMESQDIFGAFISLSQALAEEKIKISETSLKDSLGDGDDEVNKLFIENKSKDTIYLLAGEVVKGGKQDRTLSVDVVLEPGSGKQDVEVFCVEQHRWETKAENQVLDKPLEAMTFKKSSPIVKNSVRKLATVSKEQVKVWEEVSTSNRKANNQTETDTYTAIEDNKDYQKLQENYVEFFKKRLKENPAIVGFIAVTDNRVIGCDIFATNQIFSSAIETILPSYINETVYDGKKVIVDKKSVEKYTNIILGSYETQRGYLSKNGSLYEHRNRVFHLNAY